MAGLLDWITGAVQQQYAKGAPYREAVSGLLQGDATKFGLLAKDFNRRAQTPEGALDVALNFAPLGITAFHGSPYTFNKFDPAKIGTGEGAQAYGHGLYFAENPEVAKSYQAETAFKHGKKDIAEMLYSQKLGNVDKAIASLKTEMQSMDFSKLPEGYINQYNEALKKLEGFKKEPPNKGSLYKVDIADETIPKMLDYDKPLKEQPFALDAIRKSIDDKDLLKSFDYNVEHGMSGGNAYKNWVAGKTDKQRSESLLNIGVPGIRYLDQGSRGIGAGTSNFVVFDPNTIKILERNGLLVP